MDLMERHLVAEQFMRACVATGCLVIGVFFLRFHRRSNDHLFLFFAWSFFLMALDRVALGVIVSLGYTTTSSTIPYWIRAFAYLLIIAGIVHKNTSTKTSIAR